MDEKNIEGVIGSSDGSIKYIAFDDDKDTAATQTPKHQIVKLVSKVSPYLDEIKILRYDLNPNVFLTGVGKICGDMKLLTAGMLDPIHTFP